MQDMINDMTKWYDTKEDTSGVVLFDNENGKMLGPHALLCAHASGDTPSFHDSTDAYATRQENDHYVYHNTIVTVAIPNRCPASTVTRKCSPDKKGTQEVCELTGGSIPACVNCV